ncbi:MAG: hypothetical protein LBQ77_08375 [Treponema sp.]|jgi:hypothetical protein|nr:hypothetical protein [Treponema sp.]
MNKKSLFISIIALFAVLFTACKDEDDPAPPAADTRTALTAVEATVDVAADALTATAEFSGATGLTLAAADFTITPATGATIGEPTVSDDIVTVPITFVANTATTAKAFTVGIASSSTKIRGSATVVITQAAATAQPPEDTRVALTAGANVTDITAADTEATVTFTGASDLTLTEDDFTVEADTEGTNVTITDVTVNEDTVSVTISFDANDSTENPVVYTVGIAEDSEVITGEAEVNVTQAAAPETPAEKVTLTAGEDVTDIAATDTEATVTFTGASDLTLTEDDFTVEADTEGTNVTITDVTVNEDTVSVTITFEANASSENPIVYTVGIAEDSEVITGEAEVNVTQAIADGE